MASLAGDYLGQAPSAVNAAVRSTVYSGAGSTFGDARESSPAVTAHALNQTSTLLKFSNTPFAYREPTLLVKPGTNITDATAFQTAVKGDLGVSSFTVRETPTVYNGSDPSPGNFVGIYLGKGPVEWPSTVGSPHTDVGAGLRMDTSANVTTTTPPVLTYQLLCDNPNAPGSLMVYDEKSFFSEGYTTPITQTLMYSPANPPPAASGDYQAQMLGGNRLMTGFDPRTSRFGMQNSNFGESVDPTFVDDFPPNHPGTTLWLDASNGIVPGD